MSHFLTCVRTFLEYCAAYNWKLHPGKCILFPPSVCWYGRIISEDGIRLDPSNLDILLDMDRRTLGGQLQNFLCAMQWLPSFIPTSQSLVRPLPEFLERVYAHAGKLTKRSIGRISLDTLGRTPALTGTSGACKSAIPSRVTLARCNASHRL